MLVPFTESAKKSAKISAFSWIIVIGISDFWEALFLFNLLICFILFSLSTSGKVNFKSFYFFLSLWHLAVFIFQNCLKNRTFNIFKIGIRVLILWNTFFTIFKNNSRSTSAALDSLLILYFHWDEFCHYFLIYQTVEAWQFLQVFFVICYVLLI